MWVYGVKRGIISEEFHTATRHTPTQTKTIRVQPSIVTTFLNTFTPHSYTFIFRKIPLLYSTYTHNPQHLLLIRKG